MVAKFDESGGDEFEKSSNSVPPEIDSKYNAGTSSKSTTKEQGEPAADTIVNAINAFANAKKLKEEGSLRDSLIEADKASADLGLVLSKDKDNQDAQKLKEQIDLLTAGLKKKFEENNNNNK